MNTKSSRAKKNAQSRYVPGASRGLRSVDTLRAQMEDLERGKRIKAMREQRHLKQPAVVELLKKRAGAHVVGLRGYQAWEAGGGIKWENTKLLAAVFGVEAEEIMSGPREEPAPDMPAGNGVLDEVSRKLDELLQLVRALAPDQIVNAVDEVSAALAAQQEPAPAPEPEAVPARKSHGRAAK